MDRLSSEERIAYLLDPRFPGGTSAAVARELRALAESHSRISVYGIGSAMFHGREIAPVLAEALDDIGLELIWDPAVVSADRVILHNPAFLKFDTAFSPRIFARALYVVTHENFLRPGGAEGFDVASCLSLIDRASLAGRKWLAPISPTNRQGVAAWTCEHGAQPWSILPGDWFNICDFEYGTPNPRPIDRRGRHSRPGYEKFPALADMDCSFPPTSETNLILGADTFLRDGLERRHWRMVPFRGIEVDTFFSEIDFYVYFTAPTWRESFGRVLAEAMAAGKVVFSDPETARSFSGGVVAIRPGETDAAIASFLADRNRYRAQALKGQSILERFSADAFRQFFAMLSEYDQEVAA